MGTATINISLPEQLTEKMQNRIVQGEFGTPSDYVHYLVRQDLTKQQEQMELARLIQQGIDSGMSEKSGEQIFAELREHIKNKVR